MSQLPLFVFIPHPLLIFANQQTNATNSIVAVHGLKGDVYRTWTAKATEPDEKEVFWLKDLLPEEVPKARILAYGYDADPTKMFESASTNMIHHHAATLVSELHFYRRVCLRVVVLLKGR